MWFDRVDGTGDRDCHCFNLLQLSFQFYLRLYDRLYVGGGTNATVSCTPLNSIAMGVCSM